MSFAARGARQLLPWLFAWISLIPTISDVSSQPEALPTADVPSMEISAPRLSGLLLPARGEGKLPRVVWVILRGASGYYQRQMIAGNQTFEFPGPLPRDRYTLTVEADGYQPSTKELSSFEARGYFAIALGPRLKSVSAVPLGLAKTVNLQSMRVPSKALREMKAAARDSQQGKFEKALEHLQKATRLHPSFYEAYSNMGFAYFKLRQYPQAEAAWLKAVSIDPKGEASHANLGLLYLGTRRDAQALEYLSKAAALDPPSASTQTFLGEALYRLGQYAEAEAALRRALVLDPEFSLAKSRLGYVYLKLERDGQALELFREFLKSGQRENASEIEELVSKLEQRLK